MLKVSSFQRYLQRHHFILIAIQPTIEFRGLHHVGRFRESISTAVDHMAVGRGELRGANRHHLDDGSLLLFNDPARENRSRPSIDQFTQGSIRDGELWYPMYPSKPPFIPELVKLNLRTNTRTATGLKVPYNYGMLAWMGDHLYWYSDRVIFQIKDNSVEELPPFPVASTTFQTNPFLFQGELSIIVEGNPSDFDLFQFREQKWVRTAKVLLPDADKEVAARQTAQQRARTNQIIKNGSQRRLTVKSDGKELHLFLRHAAMTGPDSYYAAYRKGLELDKDQNNSAQATGWVELSPASDAGHFIEMVCDQVSPLFLSFATSGPGAVQYRLVRRWDDGRMESLREQRSPEDNSLVDYIHQPSVKVLTGPQEQSYLMQSNGQWHGEQFRPIDKTVIQPAILSMPDRKADYVSSRILIGLSLPIAWVAHWVILLAGASQCQTNRNQFEFGNQNVTLAPIFRRSIAQLIDLLLMAVLFMASVWGHIHLLDVHWTPPKFDQLADFSLQLEQALLYRNNFVGLWSVIAFLPVSVIRLQLFGTSPEPILFAWAAGAAVVDTAAIIWCYQVYSEGDTGAPLANRSAAFAQSE